MWPFFKLFPCMVNLFYVNNWFIHNSIVDIMQPVSEPFIQCCKPFFPSYFERIIMFSLVPPYFSGYIIFFKHVPHLSSLFPLYIDIIQAMNEEDTCFYIFYIIQVVTRIPKFVIITGKAILILFHL